MMIIVLFIFKKNEVYHYFLIYFNKKISLIYLYNFILMHEDNKNK